MLRTRAPGFAALYPTPATINVPSASITISATEPRVSVGPYPTGLQGLLFLFGHTYGAVGVNVACPAATISVAASAPVLVAGKSVAPPAATIALAAAAPAVSAGKRIDAPAATISLAALAPAIQATTGASVACPAAAIALAASAPTLVAGKSIAAPAATIALAAAAPLVGGGKSISAPAAVIALSAAAPTIQASSGVDLQVPTAAILMGGETPAISAGKSIAAPGAAVVLAALAPQLAAGKSIQVPAATITISAASPAIAAGKAIEVAAAAIAIGALPPVIELVAPPGTLRVIRDAIRTAWDARWPHGSGYRVLWHQNDNESVPEPGEARAWLHISVDFDVEDVRGFAGGRHAADREWRGTVEIRVMAETGYGDDDALDLLDDALAVFRSRREAGLSFIDVEAELFDSATEDGAWMVRGTAIPWAYEYRA